MEDYWTGDFSHEEGNKSSDFRGRHLNKLSRRFAEQLKAMFSSSHLGETDSINLEKIYFAKSPTSCIVRHPISLPQLELKSCTDGTKHKRLNVFPKLEDAERNALRCTSVLFEKLDETQEIWKMGLFYYRKWGFGLTLTPIPQTVELAFEGSVDFQTSIDSFIDEHFGVGNAIKLFTGHLDSSSTKLPENALSRRYESGSNDDPTFWDRCHLKFSSTSHDSGDNHKDVFDEEDHNLILIPPFSKTGFEKILTEKEYGFPFQAEFITNGGQKLKQNFVFPLKFQINPQRFRLKFIFRKSDELEYIFYTHFMVYSIMPPNDAFEKQATIQIYQKNQTMNVNLNAGRERLPFGSGLSGRGCSNKNKNAPGEEIQQVDKLFGSLFEYKNLDKYWRSGKVIRFNTIHVDTLIHNRFKVGFYYNYEIKPQPNSKNIYTYHSARTRKKKQIHQDMKWDFVDFMQNGPI